MAKERKKKKAPKNEQLESFSADPSAIVDSAGDSQVGQTSEERKQASAGTSGNRFEIGLWDLAALFSLICVTLGTLLLFFELQRFGNLFQGTWPWSVSTVEISAAAPPPSVE